MNHATHQFQLHALQSIVQEFIKLWYAIYIWAQSDAVVASHHLHEIHHTLFKELANNQNQYIPLHATVLVHVASNQ
jgi:hypothetical protein